MELKGICQTAGAFQISLVDGREFSAQVKIKDIWPEEERICSSCNKKFIGYGYMAEVEIIELVNAETTLLNNNRLMKIALAKFIKEWLEADDNDDDCDEEGVSDAVLCEKCEDATSKMLRDIKRDEECTIYTPQHSLS